MSRKCPPYQYGGGAFAPQSAMALNPIKHPFGITITPGQCWGMPTTDLWYFSGIHLAVPTGRYFIRIASMELVVVENIDAGFFNATAAQEACAANLEMPNIPLEIPGVRYQELQIDITPMRKEEEDHKPVHGYLYGTKASTYP